MTTKAIPVIKPYWETSKQPHFYARTDVLYARAPWVQTFQERSIHNPFLTSLVSQLPEGAIIAGGYVASTLRGDKNAGDIDIFFSSEEAFRKTLELFSNPPDTTEAWAFRDYTPSHTLDEVESRSEQVKLVKLTSSNPDRLPIQLIKLVWYENAEHVIDSFDLTVCQFAISGEDFVYRPLALIDLFKQQLVPHRHHYPADTLYRLLKYGRKGYQAAPMILLRIAQDIRSAKEEDPPVMSHFY